jgi:hypothetical protein
MFEYELQKIRTAELIRRADHERLVREAARARRTARKEAAGQAAGADDHSHRFGRYRFTPAA